MRVRKTRVVVAGLGDSGLLTAVNLSRHEGLEIVGVSVKPGWVSGRDVGLRLARPGRWASEYRLGFDRFPGLDRVRTVHGTLTGLDPRGRTIEVRRADGEMENEEYDVVVVSTGVRNGFWRQPTVQDDAEVEAALNQTHDRVAGAESFAVVGGGAAAVGGAAQVAYAFSGKKVDLYFPGERALTKHHPRAWDIAARRLLRLGVGLHPGHRAVVPEGAGSSLTGGPIVFSSGQDDAAAEVVLWAIGPSGPNTGWLPPELLNDDGFVAVNGDLSMRGLPDGWAVGDVAASDPLRSSARNQGAPLVARNIVASLRGRSTRRFRAPARRHSSVLGPLEDGLLIFSPTGGAVRLPASLDGFVRRRLTDPLLYRGVRR
jgi:apoptosis-inducing factor 2